MQRVSRRRDQRGFTMIELMVVVVIVGVLASVAIPLYGKYIKNSRVTEATSKLGDIITAARSHAVASPDASGNPLWPSGTSGVVDLGNTQSFSYAITSGGGANAATTPLVLTATGLAGGKMAGVTVAVTVPNINSNGNPPVTSGL